MLLIFRTWVYGSFPPVIISPSGCTDSMFIGSYRYTSSYLVLQCRWTIVVQIASKHSRCAIISLLKKLRMAEEKLDAPRTCFKAW